MYKNPQQIESSLQECLVHLIESREYSLEFEYRLKKEYSTQEGVKYFMVFTVDDVEVGIIDIVPMYEEGYAMMYQGTVYRYAYDLMSTLFNDYYIIA